MMNLFQFLRSFRHALSGLRDIATHEQSFRIQIFCGTVISISLFFLHLPLWENVLLILLIASILVLEVINSIFERITDALKPRLSPVVKEIKDMMAGAVLIASCASAVIAFLLFFPLLSTLVSSLG
jgi:diacylglycerol kinase